MCQNLQERERDETKQMKATSTEARGWERRGNKNEGVEVMEREGVDWVLLKLIPVQHAVALSASQLEAAEGPTIVLIFTNC